MNSIPPEMQKWVDIFLSNGGIWIYLIVTGIMFFEYVFPPTPGDVVIFSAGFLCGEGGASLTIILFCAYLGSALGLTVIYFLVFFSGLANLDFRKAFLFTSIACIIWNSMIILLAFFLQKKIDIVLKVLSTYSMIVFASVAAAVVIWIIWKIYKGRKLA